MEKPITIVTNFNNLVVCSNCGCVSDKTIIGEVFENWDGHHFCRMECPCCKNNYDLDVD